MNIIFHVITKGIVEADELTFAIFFRKSCNKHYRYYLVNRSAPKKICRKPT